MAALTRCCRWPLVLMLACLVTLQLNGSLCEPQAKSHTFKSTVKRNNVAAAANHQNTSNEIQRPVQKCARQSIVMARQMLAHELNYINQFNSFWFTDLDHDELTEGQKHSLSKIVMSGASASFLNSQGQPLIDIESSYFRNQPQQQQQHHSQSPPAGLMNPPGGPITLRLLRKHQDKCYLDWDRNQFSYTVGLIIGPIEHHLDVVYNLPRDLQLSQPIEWTYGRITINVPKMHYEVGFKQTADYKLLGGQRARGRNECPLEVTQVTYLPANNHVQHQQSGWNANPTQQHQSISITSSGLAMTNQTKLQVERLFDDYTRPAVSQRLRQMLRFYLNSKTLPLSALN